MFRNTANRPKEVTISDIDTVLEPRSSGPHVAPSWPRSFTHAVVCAGAARRGRSALLIGGGSRAPLLTSLTAFRRYRSLVASAPFVTGRYRLSVVHARLVDSFF